VEHCRPPSRKTSKLSLDLWERDCLEGSLMADLLEQFAREKIAEILRKLPLEERLQGLSPAELLEGLSPEERFKGLSADDLFAALSPEMRAALAQRLKDNSSPASPG